MQGVATQARFAVLLVKRFAHGAAHGKLVRTDVPGQPAFYTRCDQRGQVVEIAIEVVAAVQLETPEQRAMHVLVQPDRVRYRHDHHFAAQLARRFELGQMAPQTPGDQHAGKFVGMERGLDIDLFAAPGP